MKSVPKRFNFSPRMVEMAHYHGTQYEVEMRDYLLGMMCSIQVPEFQESPPPDSDRARLQRSLVFWRGVMDGRGYVALINASTRPGAVAYDTPTIDFGRYHPLGMVRLLGDALIASGNFEIDECDSIEALTDRGRLVVTGRLAQKIVCALYPADLDFIMPSREAVVQKIRNWHLPSTEEVEELSA